MRIRRSGVRRDAPAAIDELPSYLNLWISLHRTAVLFASTARKVHRRMSFRSAR
jgi:hypothetical protein